MHEHSGGAKQLLKMTTGIYHVVNTDLILTLCESDRACERELNAQQPNTHDHSDAPGEYPTCALASAANLGVASEGGCKGYESYCIVTDEQMIHVREEPIKGGARACVVGD